jgi:hypothetical protein
MVGSHMKITGAPGERASFERATPLALPPVTAAPPIESPFSRAVRGLGREIDAGEVQVAGASRLHNYDTGTLIALQAGIYRYTEAVDLASKIVDRASTAVHTVLSGGGH